MNQFLLQLLCLFALFVGLVWAYRRELYSEWCWAIAGFQYNPGGLVVPAGYHVPTAVYGAPAARRTSGVWRFVSGTAASYNTKGFTLRQQNADGSYTSIGFEYYNTGGGPSLPTIGIDVTGQTTASQIRTITAAVLGSQGFLVTIIGSADLRLTQPNPGDAGNVGFFGDFDGQNLFDIGPDLPQGNDVFSVYGNTVFFGGVEIAVPLRVGPVLAMGPVAAPIFDGG